jgi:uncharacterized membrane protein YkgB
MKQIYLQTTINYMFQTEPEETQRMFEEMPVEPEMREFINSNDVMIRYYVYDLSE